MTDHVLSLPLSRFKGVGDRTQALLSKMHLNTIGDLLFHLPLRYEDRTRLTPIAELMPGEHVMIQGVIESASIQGRGRRVLTCRVSDSTGVINLRFFSF